MAGHDFRYLRVAVLTAVLLSAIGLGSQTISLHDEARVAGIGRAMLDRGDYAVPLLNDRPFLEKPPLFWWVQIASYRLFGISAAAARAPSALFGFLTLLLVFAMGSRMGGPRCGLLSLVVAGTFAGTFDLMHRCVVDPALVFAVALGMLGFLYYVDPATPRQRRVGMILWGVAIPVSWFAKGVAGPGFTIGAPVLCLLATRRFRALLSAWPVALLAAAVGAVTIGPYLLALRASAGGDAVRQLVLGQTLERVVGGEAGMPNHAKPFWYYLTQLPGRIAPWLLVLPALVKSRVLSVDEGAAGRRALAGVFVFGLLLLSVATDKRGIYLVPIVPALAAPIGYWLATLGRGGPERAWDRGTVLLLLGILALCPAALGAGLAVVRLKPAPLARYGVDAMASAVTPGLLLLAVAAGAVGTAFLVRGFLRFSRSGATPGPGWLLVPLAAVLLFVQVAVYPVLDRVQTAAPLMEAVRTELPRDAGPLPVLNPREAMIGLLYFDQQRLVRRFYDAEGLRRLLTAGEAPYVLYQESDAARLPEALRARFEAVYTEPDRPDPYRLLKLR